MQRVVRALVVTKIFANFQRDQAWFLKTILIVCADSFKEMRRDTSSKMLTVDCNCSGDSRKGSTMMKTFAECEPDIHTSLWLYSRNEIFIYLIWKQICAKYSQTICISISMARVNPGKLRWRRCFKALLEWQKCNLICLAFDLMSQENSKSLLECDHWGEFWDNSIDDLAVRINNLMYHRNLGSRDII